MHAQARAFTLWVRERFPECFSGRRVLDVGGGDINGNNRDLFTDCQYEANDVAAGRNVTIALPTALLAFDDETFDTIISTECFEHDAQLSASLAKIRRMLKPYGLFVWTCASTGRNEHGTRRSNPADSLSVNTPGWRDYYANVLVGDMIGPLGLGSDFGRWRAWYSPENCDLYGVAFKGRGEIDIPDYLASGCLEVFA